MRRVTDPQLLSQLNSNDDDSLMSGTRRVTDPNLLIQLNSQSNSDNPGVMDSISNFMKNNLSAPSMPFGVNVASGLMSLAYPQQQKDMISNLPQIMSGQQPGMSENIAQGVGQSLPLMATGIGELPGIAGSAARIGANSAYNAAQNPNDMANAAQTGAIGGAIGEALPMGLNAIGNVAELLNPKKYANQLGDVIKNTYGNFKQQASDIYEDLLQRHGNQNIYQNPYMGNIQYPFQNGALQNSYNRVLSNMHNEFVSNPTYENAQDLQSQMGSYIRKLKNGQPDSNDMNIIDDITESRRNLKNDINQYLTWKNPADAMQYNKASDIIRDVLSPHDESDIIEKVAKGLKGDVQPRELLSGMNKMSESGNLPDTHYMNGLRDALTKKVQRGSFYNNAGSIGAGLGLGEMFMPGMAGAGGGLGAGVLASKFLSPAAVDIAQNPYFTKLLHNLSKGYQLGKNVGIANYANAGTAAATSQGREDYGTQ